jgi:hypothetical protein
MPAQVKCIDDEWRAYWRLLQIKGLASPEFAFRVYLDCFLVIGIRWRKLRPNVQNYFLRRCR